MNYFCQISAVSECIDNAAQITQCVNSPGNACLKSNKQTNKQTKQPNKHAHTTKQYKRKTKTKIQTKNICLMEKGSKISDHVKFM